MIALNLNVALEVPEPQDESIVNIRDAPISLFFTHQEKYEYLLSRMVDS